MDEDVLKLLDWLYENRKSWLSATDIVEAKYLPDPFDLDWMVKNDLLNSAKNRDGEFLYRLSLGGMMRRAEYRQKLKFERWTLRFSVAAIFISIVSVFVTAFCG